MPFILPIPQNFFKSQEKAAEALEQIKKDGMPMAASHEKLFERGLSPIIEVLQDPSPHESQDEDKSLSLQVKEPSEIR